MLLEEGGDTRAVFLERVYAWRVVLRVRQHAVGHGHGAYCSLRRWALLRTTAPVCTAAPHLTRFAPDRAAPDDLVLNQRQRGLSPDQAGRLWCVRQAAEHQAARITSICRSVFTCSGCSGRNRQPCMSR